MGSRHSGEVPVGGPAADTWGGPSPLTRWSPGPQEPSATLPTVPARFKQLLLTQADKFSLAEVRVPDCFVGSFPHRARGERPPCPTALLGLEPSPL